jgi:hypothetical protein
VASTAWDPQGEAQAALRTIVSDPEFGSAALSSSQTMTNLLKDLLPDAPREASVLIAASEAGLADTLQEHISQGLDLATASRLTAGSFENRTALTSEACTWVVGALASAMGMSGPAPAAPAGSAQPGPVAGGAGWDDRTAAPPNSAMPGGNETMTAGSAGAAQGSAAGQSASSGYPGGGAGYAGNAAAGYAANPGAAFAGNPAAGYAGGPGPGGPGAGYAGAPQGYSGTPGQGSGPGWASPPRKTRSKTPWIIVGALAVVVIVVLVVVLAKSPTPPKPAAVKPLSRLLPPDTDRASCKHPARPPAGAVSDDFCDTTSPDNIGFYAYQFNTRANYAAGVDVINSDLGWNSAGAGSSCPPSGSSAVTGWHSPAYPSRSGQILECFDDRQNSPLYVWTLPTQRTVFVAGGYSSATAFDDLQAWWHDNG